MSAEITVGELLVHLKKAPPRSLVTLIVMDPILPHLKMEGELYAVDIVEETGEVRLYAGGDLNG